MIKEFKDCFEYRNLEVSFIEDEIFKNYNSLCQGFAKITKSWDDSQNSQWVLRNYCAAKMILSSSILLSSVEYASKKNIRVVEPYLLYYSLLNCSRAVVLTSPFEEWKYGKLYSSSHFKIIKKVTDIISKYNIEIGAEIGQFISWAREYREIFSYRFPANGLTSHNLSIDDVIEKCKLLCEITQFQSKILENSITKRVEAEFGLDESVLREAYLYGKENFQFIDDEDYHRISYIYRKQKRPYSIDLTMTEGMVEDFFGAWSAEDSGSEDLYNPDTNWQIIFPVP